MEEKSQEQQPETKISKILDRPIILGDLTLGSPTTQTTVGSAGAASALPATPEGYLIMMVGNSPKLFPYYAIP